ncbi:hypothetical protein PMIN02_000972 [Paraphaeosphaeria minitans]|uniref:Uncharacterized protein n=1 Tax=Paraphaeosphaeria minitans TaxID=565426 RepID=A0A9P6KWX0_9PLEO|nr:hypothetical protein PMIN01_00938 [Paraphaeosphaeria minitans]
MPPKRKASEQPPVSGESSVKKPRVAAKGAVSSLVPVGERKMAKKGVVEPEMLRILCEDRDKNNERKELHFKKIIHADIDWDNKEHIDKINAWRNQIYGRAGIKNKTVLMWHKDEEAWLELFYQLLVVEANERERGIESPKPKTIREKFNEFFVGKVLLSSGGKELEPRVERGPGPFMSKLGRLVRTLRPYLEEKLSNRNGNMFVPKINQEMIEEYQKFKANLIELGCKDEKIIPWKEVEDETNAKEYVVRCREYIASLPDQNDVEIEYMDEEDDTLAGSEQLDQELLELATDPEKFRGERTETDKLATTKESSWVTVRMGSVGSSHEDSPSSPMGNKSLDATDVASPHKKRADSVAPSNCAVDEDSSELTLVGEEVIVDKVQGQ